MKLSISVPDQLWEEVSRPNESPSKVVQDALQAVLSDRAGAADRLNRADKLTELLRKSTDVGHEHDAQEHVARLVAEAKKLRDVGYAVGISLAREFSWKVFEELPRSRELIEKLMTWAIGGYDGDLPINFCDKLFQEMSDFEAGLIDENSGDPIRVESFYEGLASALCDLKASVTEQMHSMKLNDVDKIDQPVEAAQ